MDYKTLSLSGIRRLVAAIEKASADPNIIEAIINREPDKPMDHGRITVGSLINLLGQTNSSTVLPDDIVARLNAPETAPLLQLINRVNVPEYELFVVCSHFKKINSDGVAIDHQLSDSLLQKMEVNTPARVLRISELAREATDEDIIATLGDGCEITLAHLWWLLKQQPQGEGGTLLTMNRANICYVRDKDNIARAINLFWSWNSWSINSGLSGSLTNGRPYCHGQHIISY